MTAREKLARAACLQAEAARLIAEAMNELPADDSSPAPAFRRPTDADLARMRKRFVRLGLRA